MAHQHCYSNSLTDEESDEQSDGKSSSHSMYKSLVGSTYTASHPIGQSYCGSPRGNHSCLSDDESDEPSDTRPRMYIAIDEDNTSNSKKRYLDQSDFPSPNKMHSTGLTDEESDEQPDLNSHSNKRFKQSDWDSDDLGSLPKNRTLSGRSDSTGSSNFDDASPGMAGAAAQYPPLISMLDPLNSGFLQEKQESTPIYNDKARNMMMKMGYKEGTGLGRHGEGRTTIVEASKQVGRRGLGLDLGKDLEPADLSWDSSQEHLEVEEPVSWITSGSHLPIPTLDLLTSWTRVGERKKTIEDETTFCDPMILTQILSCKSIFDKLEPAEMRRVVARSNPFESIKGAIFQNRAAMKMANLDHVFDYMFTNPLDEHGNSMLDPMGLLYFADVCAGPGGFSEYVLWKKRWEAKGFGFTLRVSNDFKLEEFFAGPPESFEAHYGQDGTGDIFKPENLTCFRDYVLSRTDNLGVHFMMADGGFSVEGQENIQEVLSKQLYLCQFLCALFIVRPGGHFVCKLFDVFTPFSVGLIYLMYLCFKQVSLHKPNTSRPANSERYIICKWKREDTQPVADYLFHINIQLNKTYLTSTSEKDILHLVDPLVIHGDEAFYNYIVESNNSIGARQIVYLNKVRYFARNKNLEEKRQTDMKRKCLACWKIPDRVRSAQLKVEPEIKFNELVKSPSAVPLTSEAIPLTCQELSNFHGLYDYHCVVVSDLSPFQYSSSNSNHFFFLFGLGRSHVYTRSSKQARWSKPAERLNLELPAGTLLYAEYVRELKGEGRAQMSTLTIHIIDALFLGERDIRNLPYYDRMAQARRLVRAVSKPTNQDICPMRVKEVFPLNDIERILDRLTLKQAKNANSSPRLCYNINSRQHILPAGVLLFKAVLEPWMIGLSKREGKYYFYNTRNKQSTFEPKKGVVASFSDSFSKRLFWSWEPGVLTEEVAGAPAGDKVHRNRMLGLVANLRKNLR